MKLTIWKAPILEALDGSAKTLDQLAEGFGIPTKFPDMCQDYIDLLTAVSSMQEDRTSTKVRLLAVACGTKTPGYFIYRIDQAEMLEEKGILSSPREISPLRIRASLADSIIFRSRGERES